MLTQPTQEQLTELRLFALARAWQAQHEDPTTDDLAFDERLALLSRDQFGQIQSIVVDQTGQSSEGLATLHARRAAPQRGGTCRRLGGQIDLLGSGTGHARKRGPV